MTGDENHEQEHFTTMAFDFLAGAGAGAASALEDLIAQRLREQQWQQEQAARQAELALRRAEHEERVRRNLLEEKRLSRADQIDEARLLAAGLDQTFDPSQTMPRELTAGQVAPFRGTPFEPRIDARSTLPARQHPLLDAIGVTGTVSATPTDYALLRPTSDQGKTSREFQEDRAERERLNAMLTDPRTPPKLRTVLDLRRAGVQTAPVGSETLKSVEDEKAEREASFADFKRRAEFQDTLIRGRQTNRPTRAAFTPRDIASLTRQFRRDALAEYRAQAGPTGRVVGPDGEIIDVETFVDQYVDERLAEIEALMSDDAAPGVIPSPGRRILDGIRMRPIEDTPIPPGGVRPPAGNVSPSGPRRVEGITRRPAPRAGVPTLRYDAQGNRIP